MLKNSLIFLSILVYFSGCSSSIGTYNLENNIQNTDILRQKKEFLESKTAMAMVDLDKNSLKTIIVLPEGSNDILFTIDLSNTPVHNVQSLFIQEDTKLYLSQILIKNKDFFYDIKENKLIISLNIPTIYLMDNNLDLDFFCIYDTTEKTVESFHRKFIFKYKPMRKAEDGTYLTYEYMDNIYNNLDNLNQGVKDLLLSELPRIDKERISDKYKSYILKLDSL